MARHIAVAKAASLLGVRRSELQRLIHSGELHAFEGQLDLDELRSCFPRLALDRAPVLERIEMLRESAFARRVRSEVFASPDSLEHQLKRCNAELSVAVGRANQYRELLEGLLSTLDRLRDEGDPAEKAVAAQLNRWLAEQLEKSA